MSTIKGIKIEIDGSTKGLDKALRGVNKETKGIQTELRQVDRLLKFNPKNVELLTQKKQLLANQVGKTKEKLDQLKQAQQQVNQQFQRGDITEGQYRAFQRELVATEGQLQHYRGALGELDRSHLTMGERIARAGQDVQKFGQGMSSVGREMTMKVTAPLVAVGLAAGKLGMDFEAGMSKVKAISGATGEEMEQLKEKARDLGSKTKFSAREVGEGFEFMGLAGWTAKQSMEGIGGVLDLAAASGTDLATTSDILTDAISAFGDKASDAGRYADVLASASSSANTDVRGLGEAFKYVAPVAGALGYSVEDTTLALGLMANAGVKGSAAGTALRGALTNMISPTKAMADKMNELGINVKDSNGELKPLDVLLGDLRSSFGQLDEAQQAEAAATIFGKEAMSGMLAVINASDSDFKKLKDNIDGSEGAAKKMADTMNDNLKGKLTNLGSAIEELGLKIFDALEPVFNWLADIAADFVAWLDGLDAGVLRIITVIGLVVAAIGPLMVVGGAIITGIGMLMSALPVVTPLIAGLAAPIAGVVAVVTALGVAYALTKTRADESLKADTKAAEASALLAEKKAELVQEQLEQVNQTKELAETTLEFGANMEKLATQHENLTAKNKLSNEELLEFYTLQSELEHTTLPSKVEELENGMQALADKSGLTVEELNELKGVNDSLAEVLPDTSFMYDEYGNAVLKTGENVRALTEAELERMQIEAYNKMVEDLREADELVENYAETLSKMVDLEDDITIAKNKQKEIDAEMEAHAQTRAENDEKILALKEKQKEASFLEKLELEGQIGALETENNVLESKDKKLKKNKEQIDKTIKAREKELTAVQEQVDTTGEIIAGNRENYGLLKDMFQQQTGITLEAGKESEQIKKAVAERDKEIEKLKTSIKLEGDSNGEKQKGVEELEKQKNAIKESGEQILSVSGKIDKQNGKYDEGNKALAKVNVEHEKSGKKIDENTRRAKGMNTEYGRNIDKDIRIKPDRNVDEENRKWSKPISKIINFFTRGKPPSAYAVGTNYHKGGQAFLGEEGAELVKANGKYSLQSFGLYDLPVGAKVWTHDQTKDILRNGLVDGLGKGVNASAQGLSMGKDSNKATVTKVEIAPAPIFLDGRVIGEAVFETVDTNMGNTQALKAYMKGV